MASVSTLPKDTTATTTTTVDDSSNPTPTLSDANATTILSLSTETKAAETETETTSTAVIIVSPARRAAATPTCIGRSNAGVSWGYSLEKGRRSTMEDAVAVHSGFIRVCCKDAGGCTAPECKYSLEMSPVHFFGLFDGHGGDQYGGTELSAKPNDREAPCSTRVPGKPDEIRLLSLRIVVEASSAGFKDGSALSVWIFVLFI
ncbi:hypothetical protein V6N13_063156 [Hibiscus sabdariffa]